MLSEFDGIGKESSLTRVLGGRGGARGAPGFGRALQTLVSRVDAG